MRTKITTKAKLVFACSLATVTYQCIGAVFPAPDYSGPSSRPAFPSGFTAYDPPVADTAIASGVPAISEWTRQNGPGDTMALSGENLSLNSGSSEGQDSSFWFFGQSSSGSVLAEGTIMQQDGRRVAVKLAENLPEHSLYLMWPKNANGSGEAIFINKAESWWIGPNKHITRGDTLSVYGRNLVADEGNPVSYAYIEETGTWLTSVSANPYKADFTLPSNIANGTYTLWIHNGTGREYGWSMPRSITVDNGFSWNDDPSTWINVKNAPYNAKGDGETDDYEAIRSALSACPSGGTVYLPEGTYLMGQTIWNFGQNKRIRGDGMNATVITRHSTFSSAISTYLVINGLQNLEIRDLAFNSGASYSGSLMNNRGSKNVLFNKVRFTQQDWLGEVWDFVDIHNSENVTYRQCEIITSSGIFLGAAKQVFFDRTAFYGIRDCNGMVYEKGGSDIAFINCTAQPFNVSNPDDGYGWSKGRWIVGSGGWGGMYNVYFGGNRTSDMMPRNSTNVDPNSGEQFLFEALATTFRGLPTAVTANTIQLADVVDVEIGNVVSIAGGRGMGQSRIITAYDDATKTITLNEPWRVMPDGSSVVSTGEYMSRMAVYGNYFDGLPRATSPRLEDYTASAGVSAYGGCSDLVVDNNDFHQLRTAIFNWGNGEPSVANNANIVMQPNYFNLFKNNRIQDCLRGIANTAYIDKPDVDVEQDTVILGNVFRKNSIQNVSQSGISVDVADDQLLLDLCVYDQNTVTNTTTPVEVSPLAVNQVMIEPSTTEPPPPPPPPSPVLSSISVSGPVFVDEETTAQYYCTGTYSDGTTASVVPAWSLDSTAYANIDATGKLTTGNITEDQTVVISATLEGKTSSMTATIRFVPPTVQSLQISGPTTIDEGTSGQYSCVANYSDGSSLSVNPSWSENSAATTINSSGVLMAGDVAQDTTVTVSASFGGKSANFTVTVAYVPPTVTGLTILGAASLDEGTTSPYSCVASYSDGTTAIVSPSWSDNSTYASISANGVLAAGDVDRDTVVLISASFAGFSVSKAVTIVYLPPYITGLAISGPAELDEETSATFTCEAVYSDGSRVAVSPAWSVSGPASISASGILSAENVASDQTATITASYDGHTDTHDVAILYVPPVVTGIVISGPSRVEEGATGLYTCTASYSDGTSAQVSPTWTLDSSYASVNQSGVLFTGDVNADEDVLLEAGFGGFTASYPVTIAYVPPPVTVTGITISGPAELNEISNAVLTCTAYFSDGSSEAVVPTWSDNGAFASVDASGNLVVGNVDNDTVLTVTASYQGFQDTLEVNIWAVGTQIIYPLSDFSGKRIRADLWDNLAGEWHDLGEMIAPDQLVIENVNPSQWYWISILEYNEATGNWEEVHANWLSM